MLSCSPGKAMTTVSKQCPWSQRLIFCIREERKGRNGHETKQRKRYRDAVRHNPGAGSLGHGGFDDVSLSVRDLVEHELPVDDPGALWRRSRHTCDRQLPTQQLCASRSHCGCASPSTRGL